MDCEEFERRLPDVLADATCGDSTAGEHVRGCPACSRRLERARLLGTMIGSLPRPTPPVGVLDAVRVQARRRVPRILLARIAAAVLFVAACGFALYLSADGSPGYRLLDVEVVVESSPTDQEPALDWIYGPDVPILTAEGGQFGGPDGR